MSRRPHVAECSVETNSLRSNVLTGHKVSFDPTRQKARHSKWNYSEHLNQPQPTRNVRQTDATKSHCCRTTKSAPIGPPLTPWRAQKRQQQQHHLHVTHNISDAARCILVHIADLQSCVATTIAMIDDDLARNVKNTTITFWSKNEHTTLGNFSSTVTANHRH